MNRSSSIARVLAALSVAFVTGCATTSGTPSPSDPFEPWNRGMYEVHQVIDGNVIKPIAQAYVEYTPKIIQQTIRNFFGNIEDLIAGLTGLASGQFDLAGHDFGRVMVNTLFGIGGLIDVASDGNIPKGQWDFGLMFGAWGFPQGPYLFVPLIGPTTVRDGTGLIARGYASPLLYIVPDVAVRNSLWGVGYLDLRAEALQAESVVDQAALDRYTFIRRSYLQRRQYLLYGGNVPPDKRDEDQ